MLSIGYKLTPVPVGIAGKLALIIAILTQYNTMKASRFMMHI